MHLTTPNYITINASLQIKTAFRTTNWLELSHKFWNNDTHSNFSLTNQSNVIKKNIMHMMVFKNEKKPYWLSIIQRPINAGSRKLGEKTAWLADLDYRSH